MFQVGRIPGMNLPSILLTSDDKCFPYFNRKSWPHTDRLTYPAGGLMRWRWINATDENHPLHLHGHYFMLEGIGDERHWTPL